MHILHKFPPQKTLNSYLKPTYIYGTWKYNVSIVMSLSIVSIIQCVRAIPTQFREIHCWLTFEEHLRHLHTCTAINVARDDVTTGREVVTQGTCQHNTYLQTSGEIYTRPVCSIYWM
jgi:hypothetical protein